MSDTKGSRISGETAFMIATRDDSESFFFATPVGTIANQPAPNEPVARKLLARGYRGFDPEDFDLVDGWDAERREYPDPAHSGREVNEHDLWMLMGALRVHKYNSRRNPTERMINALIDHWESTANIPLHNRRMLQEAHGIGPSSASIIVSAAYSNNLIDSVERSDE